MRSSIDSNARYGLIAAPPYALEQRHVVHFARVARLDHDPHLRSRAFANQMVVHGGHEEQRRNRRQLRARITIRQDEGAGAVGDERRCLRPHTVERGAQRLAATADLVQARR